MRNIVVVACIILLIGVLYIRKSRYKSQRGGGVNPLLIGGLCVSVVVGGLVIAYFANADFKNKIDGVFGSENENTIQTPTGCAAHMTEAACPSPCEWNVDECSEPTPQDPGSLDPIDSYKTPYYNSNYWPSSCSPPPAGTSTTECTDPCRIDSITDPNNSGVYTCTIGGHPVAMMSATSTGCADGYALVDLNKVPKTWTTKTSVSYNSDLTAGANTLLADHSTGVVGDSDSNAYVVKDVGAESYRRANPNAKLACRLMCGCGPKSNIYKYMDTPGKIFSSNTWLTPGGDTQNKIGDFASSSRVTCRRDISLMNPDISDTRPNPMTYEYDIRVTKPTDNTDCDSVNLTTGANNEDKKKICVDHHCMYDQRSNSCIKPNFPETQWCKSIPSTSDYNPQQLPIGFTSSAIYPSGSESLRSIAPSPRVGRCTCTHGYPEEHHNCRRTEEKCAACKPGFLLDTDKKCKLRCGYRFVSTQKSATSETRHLVSDLVNNSERTAMVGARCDRVKNSSEHDKPEHSRNSNCCATGLNNTGKRGVKCCANACAGQENGCEGESGTDSSGHFADTGAQYLGDYTPSQKGLIN